MNMRAKVHPLVLSLLLAYLGLASLAAEKADTIDSLRSARLEQVVTAFSSGDADALRIAVSSADQPLSREEASALLTTISNAWGEFGQHDPVLADEALPVFDKGDMLIVVHWGNLPTQAGAWQTFKDASRKQTYLRIGLLFGKDDAEPGQLLACEFPLPGQTTPQGSGADDS